MPKDIEDKLEEMGLVPANWERILEALVPAWTKRCEELLGLRRPQNRHPAAQMRLALRHQRHAPRHTGPHAPYRYGRFHLRRLG